MITPTPRATLTCPLCGGTSFREETERSQGRWGVKQHVINLMVCQQCAFVMHFYEKSSYWDFGG